MVLSQLYLLLLLRQQDVDHLGVDLPRVPQLLQLSKKLLHQSEEGRQQGHRAQEGHRKGNQL